MSNSKFENTKSEISDGEKLRLIERHIMGWYVNTDPDSSTPFDAIQPLPLKPFRPLDDDRHAAELEWRIAKLGWCIEIFVMVGLVEITLYHDDYSPIGIRKQFDNDTDPVEVKRRALVDAAAEVASKLK